MDRPEEYEENYLTKLEDYCDWVEKLAAYRSMECNSLKIKLEANQGEHKCNFYINANLTGYSRCECGKRNNPLAL